MRSNVKFDGAICQLGRQTIRFSSKQLQKDAKEVNFQLKNSPVFSRGLECNEDYFRALGFENVSSIDISSDENPTYILDLGKEQNNDLNSQFDLIFDGGTIEHIFTPEIALKNIVKMLKVGGSVIHQIPCNNLVEHGFFQFSPSFFEKFYEENGFSVSEILLTCRKHTFMEEYLRSKVYIYDKKEMFRMHVNNINLPGQILLHVVAKKKGHIKKVNIPKYDIQAENKSEKIMVSSNMTQQLIKTIMKKIFPRNIILMIGKLLSQIIELASYCKAHLKGHRLKLLGRF
jgi:SAM-dependent methyltransferase